MSSQSWHVYLQGEPLGPLATETVVLMLKQGRLQFLDFVWAAHLTKWQRLADLDEFAALIPPYPSAPIPSRKIDAAAQPEPTPEPTLKPEPKPEPKVEVAAPAKKAPKPAPKVWPKVRRFDRVPSKAERAVLKEHGGFDVVNVSIGGIFLSAPNPLAIGTEVTLTLELNSIEKKLEMTGVVIRQGIVDGFNGFAIEFTRLNPAHKRILHDYVASLISLEQP
jgi:Tfp pilus assembly protein PilZ